MLVRVADWCYRRRGLVVICWTLVLLGSIALAGAFAGTITPNYLPPGTDSKAASQTLKRTFPQKAGSSLQIVVQADEDFAAEPSFRPNARRQSRRRAVRLHRRHQVFDDRVCPQGAQSVATSRADLPRRPR